jgi:hypothetical protein
MIIVSRRSGGTATATNVQGAWQANVTVADARRGEAAVETPR